MPTIINDIFRLNNGSYSARTGIATNSLSPIPTSSPTEPARGDIDKITLSQLAQSLKGAENLDGGKQALSSLFKEETGEIFNSLNKQDQDLLQSLFDQGSASAQDIEFALQAEANSVILGRVHMERPRSAEEVAIEKEATYLNEVNNEYNAAISAAAEIEMEASRQFHFGNINEDQLNSLKEESKKQIDELNSNEKYKNIQERASAAFDKAINAAGAALKDFLGGPVTTTEQQSARSKLNDLGFGGAAVSRALKTYAYQRDSLTMIR